MSIAIAMRDWRLIDNQDYEPVSDGSRVIRNAWQQERNYLSRSASDWIPAIEGALRRIEAECRNANWDGEGALPVERHTIDLSASIATTLYTMLPKGTPAPDVMPESDGEICISWSVDATRMFALSVGEHGKINFAGQFGTEGGVHAWQPIHATSSSALEKSLEDIVRYVGRLYPPVATRSAA